MTKIDRNLGEVFDLELVQTTAVVPVENSVDRDADGDFELVRNNLIDLAEKGKEAMAEMMEVAKQSENPRAYEVFSTMLNTIASINNQIVDVHTKKHKMKAAAKGSPTEALEGGTVNNTQNIVFTGSTAELSTMIRQLQKK